MSLEIWIAILLNIIIAGSLVAGIFLGKKDGIALVACKLGSLLIGGIIAFFTAPLLTKAVSNIEFIKEALTGGFISTITINALLFTLILLLVHLVGSLIMLLIENIIDNKIKSTLVINTAKPVKLQGLTRKDTIRLRKQQKKLEKEKNKQASKQVDAEMGKPSKIFGAIIGALYAIILCFAVMLPLKPILKDVSSIKPSLETLPQAYEYTAYGQLDKATGVDNFLIDTIIENTEIMED